MKNQHIKQLYEYIKTPSPTRYFSDAILFKSYLFAYLILELFFGSRLAVNILKKIRKIEIKTKTKKFNIFHKIEQVPYIFDLYYNNHYNPKISGGSIIDVGAHIGTSTLGFLKDNKKNRIYSVEPEKENFNLLKKNIKENGLNERVKIFNISFSDKEGFDYLYFSIGSGGHTLFPIGKDKTKIKTITLDNFVKKENIKNISVIKIDTEGSELKILKGAKFTLKKQSPLLLIELHPFFVKPSKILKYLKKIGYKIKLSKNLLIIAKKPEINLKKRIYLKKHDKKV